MTSMTNCFRQSPEELEKIRQYHSPTAFDRLLPGEQEALRLWVRLALAPADTSRGAEYTVRSSLALTRHAEAALGWSVTHGALKGALRTEGYAARWLWEEGTWDVACRRRCRHRMRRIKVDWDRHTGWPRPVKEYAFACPAALRVGSIYRMPNDPHPVVTAIYPALCAATEAELASFDTLRQEALRDRRAWQQARRTTPLDRVLH